MNKSGKKNKKFTRQTSNLRRSAKTRTERIVKEEKPLMLFSFKDFQFNSQIPPGQTYKEWQESELLAYTLDKFGYICNLNRVEAVQNNFLKVYGKFPPKSKFTNPFPDVDLNWAVVMKIGGQKGRVAGHIDGHIFYVVFLDAEHKFYLTSR